MNIWLRRFAFVGLTATFIDVGIAVLLMRIGLPIVIADVFALTFAAIAARTLHEKITLKNDPHARWIRNVKVFVAVVLVAAVIDLIILISLDPGENWKACFTAKITAVFGAAVARGVSYRFVLFREFRNQQMKPNAENLIYSTPRISLIIPTFEEADRIAETLSTINSDLRSLLQKSDDMEVIVVDDGSTDATSETARNAGADLVIRLEYNKGKGAAIRAGVQEANGSVIAFTDADLAYNPSQVLKLATLVESGFDMVVGSRQHIETKNLVRAGKFREIGGRLINIATTGLLLGHYRDTQCGLKAFKSQVAKSLFAAGTLDGFSFDVELFHLAERWNLSLMEVPVEVENSQRSSVSAFRDGLFLLLDLIRIRQRARRGAYPESGIAQISSSSH
ncbi:MAG: glycosyltransferase [Acidimicrobiales bacterium]|nr:glycosyltransferase [Acidimicrobiales bacterium]